MKLWQNNPLLELREELAENVYAIFWTILVLGLFEYLMLFLQYKTTLFKFCTTFLVKQAGLFAVWMY